MAACLLAAITAAAAEPDPEDPRLDQIAEQWEKIEQLELDGKTNRALALTERTIALEREVYGDVHEEVAVSLWYLADLYQQHHLLDKAAATVEQLRAIRLQLNGEQSWQMTDVRLFDDYIKVLRGLTQEELNQLDESLVLYDESIELCGAGHYQQAIEKAEQSLAIDEAVLGGKHFFLANTIDQVAYVYRLADRYEEAHRLIRRVYDMRREALGTEHPDFAAAVNDLAINHDQLGEFEEAIVLFNEALEIYARTLGKVSAEYGATLNSLGMTHYRLSQYKEAEKLLLEALEITREAVGEESYEYADSLVRLGNVYADLGQYAQAEDYYQRNLKVFKEVLGDDHPDYAVALNNLALLYHDMGDHAQAEPLYRQVLQILHDTVGDEHRNYATTLQSMAALYESMGDYALAGPLYEQALEINRRILGEDHPDYADSLMALGMLYYAQHQPARAEPLCAQALEIRRAAFGDDHPEIASNLNNLAIIYQSLGEPKRAEELLHQQLDICREVFGTEHAEYATGLNNLGLACLDQGDHERAIGYLQQAIEIRRNVQGEQHPNVADSLVSLGMAYDHAGKYAEAIDSHRRAVGLMRLNMDRDAVVQSERQQLAMAHAFRYCLEHFISVAQRAELPADEVYGEVLAWKGAVSSRQSLSRAMRKSLREADGEQKQIVSQLFEQLTEATRSLASISRTAAESDDQQRFQASILELNRQIEDLERRLAEASEPFRAQLQQRQRTVDDIRATLPPGGALLDLLVYSHYLPPTEDRGGYWQRRIAAFVVRPDRDTAWMDLGPAEPVELAVGAWRRYFGEGSKLFTGDPALRVRQIVWEPLAAHLEGVNTLLIAPDGALALFPWAALPGKEPGTYLIEEMAVGVVPIPQLLPEMLASAPAMGQSQPDADASLLLVGYVDFDAQTGDDERPAADTLAMATPAAERGEGWQQWSPLAGTRTEIVTVMDSFLQRFDTAPVRSLRGSAATEQALREMAPNYRFLHVATHGYFAPPELRSALDAASHAEGSRGAVAGSHPQANAGYHPGLLSGLVLAGANHKPQAGHDDGILTALEVSALDLGSVELATLSACETGQGQGQTNERQVGGSTWQVAGGEGLLGLQRAFQIAGARSVIGTLWKVKDDAARMLMVDFYDNLWGQGMSKIEALRQAQLTMLREGAHRGALVLEDPKEEQQRLPPYFWAAFVLSGDWR